MLAIHLGLMPFRLVIPINSMLIPAELLLKEAPVSLLMYNLVVDRINVLSWTQKSKQEPISA